MQKVVGELDSLVNQHHTEADKIEMLLNRVNHLEDDVQSATNEIRSILNSLKTG